MASRQTGRGNPPTTCSRGPHGHGLPREKDREGGASMARRRSPKKRRREDLPAVREGRETTHPEAVPTASKRVAARYHQLPDGHTMTAAFLREKWGWADSDLLVVRDKPLEWRASLQGVCYLAQGNQNTVEGGSKSRKRREDRRRQAEGQSLPKAERDSGIMTGRPHDQATQRQGTSCQTKGLQRHYRSS